MTFALGLFWQKIEIKSALFQFEWESLSRNSIFKLVALFLFGDFK